VAAVTPAVLTSLVTIIDFIPGKDLPHIDLDQVESTIDHETPDQPLRPTPPPAAPLRCGGGGVSFWRNLR